MRRNIDALIGNIRKTVASHRLGEGEYARYLWDDGKGYRKLGVNEYGCADAANILYTIGDFERDPDKRAQWIATLQGMQNPETGLFHEETHHPFHTTAHCLAALELFDAQPRHPLTAMMPYLEREKLEAFLLGLDWVHQPWPQSHQGAGLYASLVITRSAPLQWQDWYFDWLRENVDPECGMSFKGTIQTGGDKPCHHMFGWFHYMFNHAYGRRPFPCPEKLIDVCLDMYYSNALDEEFAREIGFREIDWVFCITRALRESGHRFDDCQAALHDFADKYLDYLDGIDWKADDAANDLHMLFGTVCVIAELQQALPGQLVSTVPLKLVLDRRPFI